MPSFPFVDEIDPWILVLLFAIPFVATLIVVPWAVVKLPADYFQHKDRQHSLWSNHNPLVRLLLLLGKNALGILLVMMGIAMLVLPGQGLLTILIGILLLDFPGKYRFQCWLVSRKVVLRPINWLRAKRHKGPLQLDS